MSVPQPAGTGIWSAELFFGDPAAGTDAAAELEDLGYTGLWYPGGFGGQVFDTGRRLLAATGSVPVGIGILNLWMHEPGDVAAGLAGVDAAHPDRFILGIGASHKSMVDSGRRPPRFSRPWSAMNSYLDALDTADPPVHPDRRLLAALGPKMLDTARTRAAGAHPFFVTAEHTRAAREALGPAAFLAPEHAVVLETDPGRARDIARKYTNVYLTMPNYSRNLLRLGWTEDDVRGAGSDRLVDALVAWGDPAAIRDRIERHRAAGADHICASVITADWGPPFTPPIAQWRELAPALTA